MALRNIRFALIFADSIGLCRTSPAIEEEGPAGKASGRSLSCPAARAFTIPSFTLGAL